MPGARTVWSGNSGICIGLRPAYRKRRRGCRRRRGESDARCGAESLTPPALAGRQCEQERGVPSPSAVRKLEPQPQPETAFGLLTVKPAPMSVST